MILESVMSLMIKNRHKIIHDGAKKKLFRIALWHEKQVCRPLFLKTSQVSCKVIDLFKETLLISLLQLPSQKRA